MKKGILLTLVASALLLASCGGKGPDLGKEINKSDFEQHVAEFNSKEMENVKQVETKGHTTATVDGETKTMSLDAVIKNDEKPTSESAIAAVTLISLINVEYVYEWYSKFPGMDIKTTYYYNEGNKCTSVSVFFDVSASASGVSGHNKLDAKYSWNEYGFLAYVSEFQEISVSGQGESHSAKTECEFTANYIF